MIDLCLPELGLTPAKARDSALPDGHEDGRLVVAHPHLHPQSLPRREEAPPARELANLWESVETSCQIIPFEDERSSH